MLYYEQFQVTLRNLTACWTVEVSYWTPLYDSGVRKYSESGEESVQIADSCICTVSVQVLRSKT